MQAVIPQCNSLPGLCTASLPSFHRKHYSHHSVLYFRHILGLLGITALELSSNLPFLNHLNLIYPATDLGLGGGANNFCGSIWILLKICFQCTEAAGKRLAPRFLCPGHLRLRSWLSQGIWNISLFFKSNSQYFSGVEALWVLFICPPMTLHLELPSPVLYLAWADSHL